MNNIDILTLRLMLSSAAAHLKNNRKLVDDLNVFPVPDGDTGTNMSLTFSGATEMVLANTYSAAGELLSSLASASLRNARGNSGVILSQIIRGFSKALEGKDVLTVSDIKDGLVSAKNTAYRAVMKPTEGTILTVIRELSEFASENFGNFDDVLLFAEALVEAGNKSLDNTPNLLPALKKAGVVDAGGKGLMTLVEGAYFALKNGEAIVPEDTTSTLSAVKVQKTDAEIKFLYCTEFIINKKESRNISQFRTAISEKGDCMLVIDDDDIVKVHIHTNHPGFVLEQAVKLGELTNLKIDNMKYQHNENNESSSSAGEDNEEDSKISNEPTKKYGFAAVSAGEGISEIFRSLGVDEIIEGGQTMNPSTQDLLLAVEKIPAEIVYILPNNKNIILAADQVDALTTKTVFVVPTTNIPEGISAMTAFDESIDPESNLSAMNEFASYVKCGQVTFAARDTVLDGMEIKLGDCLAVCGKEISAVTHTPEEAVFELCEKMVDDESGVISVYYGEDISADTSNKLAEDLEERFPDLDVSVIHGGQPVYFYIISVE